MWALPEQEIKAREMEELARTLEELGIAPDTQEAADAADAAAKRAKKKDRKAKGAEGDGAQPEPVTNGTAAPAPAAAAVEEEEAGAGEEAAAVDPAEVRLGAPRMLRFSNCHSPIPCSALRTGWLPCDTNAGACCGKREQALMF